MSPDTDLTKATDQCVMCGMCLPHCPTYQISQHEAESPRGRISLVKAFTEGQLDSSEALETHLQSCTGCMKCQQVCPANVPYQAIIDQGRSLYRNRMTSSSRLLQTLSLAVLTRQWGHQLLMFTARLAKRLPVNNRLVQLLKLINLQNRLDVIPDNQQAITVLPGCTGNVFDQQTLNSIIKILNQLNIVAVIPDNVMCCGALARHSGHPKLADKQVNSINKYLSDYNTTEFVSFASGCGRQLNDHVSSSQHSHKDIISWLAQSTGINSFTFAPLAQRVLVHYPCTLKDSERKEVIELLGLIPDIQLSEFDDDLFCCGSGGMQLMLPENSNRALLDAKISTIRILQPDVIVSSNVGCS